MDRDVNPTPPAQAITAEEFAARIHFMARDVIPRPTLTIGDVIDIVKERDALLLAAARQSWEAERAVLLRRIIEAVEAEPELPGEPTQPFYDFMNGITMDRLMEAFRVTVRLTKSEIVKRIEALS